MCCNQRGDNLWCSNDWAASGLRRDLALKRSTTHKGRVTSRLLHTGARITNVLRTTNGEQILNQIPSVIDSELIASTEVYSERVKLLTSQRSPHQYEPKRQLSFARTENNHAHTDGYQNRYSNCVHRELNVHALCRVSTHRDGDTSTQSCS